MEIEDKLSIDLMIIVDIDLNLGTLKIPSATLACAVSAFRRRARYQFVAGRYIRRGYLDLASVESA